MHIRWPFTFRRKRAILFKPVPGVDPRYAREFVCAPYCAFGLDKYAGLTWPAIRWVIPAGARFDFSKDDRAISFAEAMRNAYQSDAERKRVPDYPLRPDIDINYIDLGIEDALGIHQDGNRAARTGGET